VANPQEGWIKLWRKIWDDPFFREKRTFSRFEAWVDMILMADHADTEHLIKGQIVTCKRGEIITSERFLENRWGWSRDKIRRFLGACQAAQKSNQNQTATHTTIHIINYDTYQSLQTDGQTTHKATEKPQSNRNQTKYKNVKEVKKINIDKLSDEEFQNYIKKEFAYLDLQEMDRKMNRWLTMNQGRRKTRRFIVKWLDRQERPVESGIQIAPTDPLDRRMWELEKIRKKEDGES
jgi:hypothetical protein